MDKKKLSIFIIILIVALYLVFSINSENKILGGSPDGTASIVATSTFQSVTAATAELLFATSTNCVSRAISTQGNAIMLTFSDKDGDRPTAVNGHIQAASTTVSYDSELYGCDAVWIYPYGTDTITVTESR